jgi:anti-anti-sigma factor
VQSFVERDAGGGVSVMALVGEHDVSTASELDQRLGALQAGGRCVVVELAGAAFVDSAIIGTLINARRRADAGQAGFAIAAGGPDGIVRRALRISGLLDTLGVYETREAAIVAAGRSSCVKKLLTRG